MNWIDNILFSAKSHDGILTRRLLEPLLMKGCVSFDETNKRLQKILNDGLMEKEGEVFKITNVGDQTINLFFNDAITKMDIVKNRIKLIVDNVDLKGGVSGLYFLYNKIHVFGFYPFKGDKGEFLLNLKLPSLIVGKEVCDPISILITMNIVEETSILDDYIKAHIKMLDECMY